MRLLITSVLVGVMVTVGLLSLGTAQESSAQESRARGGFQLTVHTHSSEFRGPGGAPLLFEPTDPLSFPLSEDDFSYSSVSCEDPAPFNDVALKFNPDYPGIDDPAAVRHFVVGEVTDVDEAGRISGETQGTLTTFLCEDGEEGDEIRIEFDGRSMQKSDNEVRFRGTFEIVGGTGRFADLEGHGSMTGSFTCLEGVLEPEGAESCAELGVFSDAVFRLRGTYSDPTA